MKEDFMKHKTLLILLTCFFSQLSFASDEQIEEKVRYRSLEEIKAEHVKRADEKIKKNEKIKICLQEANDASDMNSCYE